MPYTVETHEEFIARHGSNYVDLGGGHLLLPDGASTDPYGVDRREPPPEGTFDRLKLQEEYWKVRVQRAETDFKALKAALQGLAGAFTWPVREYGVPPTKDGPEALRHLQTIVQQRRAELAAIQAQIEETPEMVAHRTAERTSVEASWAARDHQNHVAAEVQGIDI